MPNNVRKKNRNVNITHLVNFTYPEGDKGVQVSRPSSNYRTKQIRKERFTFANFRFVVFPEAKDTLKLSDPDRFLEWQNIAQVLVTKSHDLQCPVCLQRCRAPRVTKCGHIYCLPCILRLLAYSDSRWAACPICFEDINRRDLKPVRWVESLAPPRLSCDCYALELSEIVPKEAANPTIEFTLMERRLSSILTFPVAARCSDFGCVPSASSDLALTFCKILQVDDAYWTQMYALDVLALQSLLDETLKDSTGPSAESRETEVTFIGRAIESCQETALSREIVSVEESSQKRKLHSQSSEKSFYFYQASDGSSLYLHPLDIKILKGFFGEYRKFPDTLDAKVLDIVDVTLDESLRRRCPYLGHLALGCDMRIAEVNLVQSHVVPASFVNDNFSKEVTARCERLLSKLADPISAPDSSNTKQASESTVNSIPFEDAEIFPPLYKKGGTVAPRRPEIARQEQGDDAARGEEPFSLTEEGDKCMDLMQFYKKINKKASADTGETRNAGGTRQSNAKRGQPIVLYSTARKVYREP